MNGIGQGCYCGHVVGKRIECMLSIWVIERTGKSREDRPVLLVLCVSARSKSSIMIASENRICYNERRIDFKECLL